MPLIDGCYVFCLDWSYAERRVEGKNWKNIMRGEKMLRFAKRFLKGVAYSEN